MGKTEERRPQMVSQTSPEPDNSKEDSTDPPPKKPGSKAAGRKRTKTGCLTCRKRRIKCGEERPKCQNCVKSKRHCEGYNQRVIFKDPLNAYRPPQSTPTQVSFTTPILGQPPTRHGDQHAETTAGTIQPLAPRPTGAFSASTKSSDSAKIVIPSPVSSGSERRFYNWADDPSNQASPDLRLSPKQQPHSDIRADLIDRPWIPEPRKEYVTKMQVAHYDFNALVKTEGGEKSPYRPAQISPLDWSAGPSPTVPYHQPFPTPLWMPPSVPFPPGHSRPSQPATPSARIIGFFDGPEGVNISQSRGQLGIQPHWELSNPQTIDSRPDIGSPLGERQISPDEAEDPFDISDEDTMMGEDEDEPWEEELQDDHLKNNDLGIVVALQASQDNQAVSLRSFTSFIDRPNMLATYVPSIQATPMCDRMTATIFCHFVNVTGPSMSMFERHPANPSLMFQGTPVPRSQQHIWAYTFPTLALQNPALLHAMLALASLHIAKLQNGPITASLKHYAIGLRRVAKSVSLPTRRGHPATLAAAMLLAFYECWSADHQKWSNHLLGAKQLVREIDFVGMTRYLKNRRALQRLEEQAKVQQAQMHPFDDRNRFLSPVDEVDENLVGILMGKKVRYDQYGQVMEDFVSEPCWTREYTERDLEIYETQRDLFWWYCKQDVYQSILGGGRLFMDYTLWSHCPPRAPLGRLNATYGTFDHLILLMGRLADFAAKDLKRKRLAMKVNGGWRPPTSTQQATTSPTPQTPTMMPGFSGMVPGVKEAQLPMGFSDSRDTSTSPQSARSEELDLSNLTAAAEEEWLSIRHAFSVLEDHFGGDFQALGPEFSAPIETPFGPALQYRTYGIAGIWMNYYMGLIVCHRSHPSMPPASMVAAGIMRRQTEWYANELGRIAAGIAPDCAVRDGVNPGVGAALIESSTCLFVSAIQYQDPSQRHWTISRLRHIARLTGWQTALAIASGCEASWVKTGELGKGPPYTHMSPHECMYPEDPNYPKHPNHPINLNNPNHPSAYNASRDGSYRQSNGWRREGEIRNLLPDICINSRRIDRAFEGKSPQERRNVIRGTDRVHYALGVLGLNEDFVGLEVGDDDG